MYSKRLLILSAPRTDEIRDNGGGRNSHRPGSTGTPSRSHITIIGGIEEMYNILLSHALRVTNVTFTIRRRRSWTTLEAARDDDNRVPEKPVGRRRRRPVTLDGGPSEYRERRRR